MFSRHRSKAAVDSYPFYAKPLLMSLSISDLPPVSIEKAMGTRLHDELVAVGRGTTYLLYFAEGGFSNQKICLEHAYYFARALNRTLILPPVLPHLGKGYVTKGYVFDSSGAHFKTRVDLQDLYLAHLPKKKYMKMEKVLDLSFSFPDVPTVDVQEFFSTMIPAQNLSTWVLETNYSHFNTRWGYNRPDLEGTHQFTLQRKEYGITRLLEMQYRDVAKTIDDSIDLLTVLDTFKMMFDDSLTNPSFQSRMSDPIRQAASRVWQHWGVPSYAALHIRGRDGPFSEEERLQDAITTTMEKISLRMMNWFEHHRPSNVDKVGLYVATDVKDLFEH
jgi:hypothetical protein